MVLETQLTRHLIKSLQSERLKEPSNASSANSTEPEAFP